MHVLACIAVYRVLLQHYFLLVTPCIASETLITTCDVHSVSESKCFAGRMGDIFPHTITCQDQRLRSGEMYSTLVQELGRLCRYPSVLPHACEISHRTALVDIYGSNDQPQRLSLLKQSLVAAYGTDHWSGQSVLVL